MIEKWIFFPDIQMELIIIIERILFQNHSIQIRVNLDRKMNEDIVK